MYDLHQSNSWLQHIGLGMYHSGIEVLGMEYTFSEAGIGQHAPRRISGDACVYKTTEVPFNCKALSTYKLLVPSAEHDEENSNGYKAHNTC